MGFSRHKRNDSETRGHVQQLAQQAIVQKYTSFRTHGCQVHVRVGCL